MHQQYRLKQGMKNQQGLKSHRHQGKLIWNVKMLHHNLISSEDLKMLFIV
jgi:hypothetical protein